jgi:hypothetical protein
MATGGVFSLLTNDGKADRLILANEFLKKRISDVMCSRRAQSAKDITPTLRDIEKTHILFMNAHFKPFAAVGYEYNKVRPQSGNPALGNTITFSIPQFGDFFHDMVCRQVLSSFSSDSRAVPSVATIGDALTATSFPATNELGVSAPVDWDNTTLLSATVAGSTVALATYTLVDWQGAAAGANFQNLVRYVEFPGERLNQEVKFDVNGNPLCEYNDSATVMLRKFTIGADKMIGYKRCVGQEVEYHGHSGPKIGAVHDSHATTAVTGTDSGKTTTLTSGVHDAVQDDVDTNKVTTDTFLAANFPDSAHTTATVVHTAGGSGYNDVYRESFSVVDGPQTPKLTQPSLEIWNKLNFWFNRRADLAIASVAIPSGQRYVTLKLATQAQLVVEEPGLYVKRVLDMATEGNAAINSRTIEYRPFHSAGTISTITLSEVELYVNNMFVNPEIHDIYIQRVGFSLIRVFRQHKVRVNATGTDDKQLSQLKWPIEYMFVGLRPVWNVDATNKKMHRDWHRMTKTVDVQANDAQHAEVSDGYSNARGGDVTDTTTTLVAGDVLAVATTGATNHTSKVYDIVPKSYVRACKTVSQMSLTAHGIKINDEFPERFFNAYVPLSFGGANIVTPEDEGVYMFNFALYPGSYQPSGHINVSRAREFYLKWTSAYVSSTTTADLIVVAMAINFLLIANGSAVLRFST